MSLTGRYTLQHYITLHTHVCEFQMQRIATIKPQRKIYPRYNSSNKFKSNDNQPNEWQTKCIERIQILKVHRCSVILALNGSAWVRHGLIICKIIWILPNSIPFLFTSSPIHSQWRVLVEWDHSIVSMLASDLILVIRAWNFTNTLEHSVDGATDF